MVKLKETAWKFAFLFWTKKKYLYFEFWGKRERR